MAVRWKARMAVLRTGGTGCTCGAAVIRRRVVRGLGDRASVMLTAVPRESRLGGLRGMSSVRGVSGGAWQRGFQPADVYSAARPVTGKQVVSEINEHGCGGSHGRHAAFL